MRLAVSRSHRNLVIDKIKAGLTHFDELPCGSVGAKIGLLVAGLADAYVEPSTYTSKWDVCGADAILRGAGGVLTDLSGEPIRYNDAEIKNPRGFAATNRACHQAILAAIPESYLETLRDVPKRL